VALLLINAPFFFLDLLLQLNAVIQLMTHQIPQVFFALGFSLQVLIVVVVNFEHRLLVDVSHLLINGFFVLLIISDHVLEIVLHVHLPLDIVLLLKVLESRPQLQVLLHPVHVVHLLGGLELLVDYFFLNCHLQFLPVLFLQVLLPHSGFVLLSLIVLRLLLNHCSPFIDLSIFGRGVVSFLMVDKLLDGLLLKLNGFFNSLGMEF